MKELNVVNYHITNRCNYHCTYCFGKFCGQHDPTLEEAKLIIDRVYDYFKCSGIENGRINFAGGEPTLYGFFDVLIDYSDTLGIAVSIVTNGSLLTPDRIRSWQGKVSCIGISIDSLMHDTNRAIGRCCKKRTTDPARLSELSKVIHDCGVSLKINTVVSRLNVHEDLSSLYRALDPKKIKLFQMHLVKGINDRAKPLAITGEEYKAFCARHGEFDPILVCEAHGSMENSYLMINPKGEFQLNDNGRYQTFGDLKDSSLGELPKSAPLDPVKFNFRYLKEG